MFYIWLLGDLPQIVTSETGLVAMCDISGKSWPGDRALFKYASWPTEINIQSPWNQTNQPELTSHMWMFKEIIYIVVLDCAINQELFPYITVFQIIIL